jgi:Galactose oxidase, central domain/Kelch motif
MSHPHPGPNPEENPHNIDNWENEVGNSNVRVSSSVNVSQAQLRQQAHAVAVLGSANVSSGHGNDSGTSVGSRHVHQGVQNLSLAETFQRPTVGPIQIQEYGVNESPTSENASGWSVVKTNGGTPPSARSLHAAAVLNGVLYIWGGYNGDRLNTFHAFSFAEKRWSPVLPSTSVSHGPSPRDRHVAFAFGNTFYVHGGFDGTSRVSDFWGFDFSSMQWMEVEVLAGRPPSPRHSHAAVVHGQSLYIFGGYDGSYK